MKVTFLSRELVDLEIDIDPVKFEKTPEIGDYIHIENYLTESQKEIFKNYMSTLNKISIGAVVCKFWHKLEGENSLQLSLFFKPIENKDVDFKT